MDRDKLAGISHPTAITDLGELAAKGILKKTGAGRTTRYLKEKH